MRTALFVLSVASVAVAFQADSAWAAKKIEKRPVELARALGSRWLLDSGLVAGERLVVDGFQRVKPGDKVSPQPVVLKTSKGEAGPPQAPEDGR